MRKKDQNSSQEHEQTMRQQDQVEYGVPQEEEMLLEWNSEVSEDCHAPSPDEFREEEFLLDQCVAEIRVSQREIIATSHISKPDGSVVEVTSSLGKGIESLWESPEFDDGYYAYAVVDSRTNQQVGVLHINLIATLPRKEMEEGVIYKICPFKP